MGVFKKALDFFWARIPKEAKKRRLGWGLFAVFAALFLLYALFISPPLNFPVGKIVTIEQGSTLSGVSSQFTNEHLVRFSLSLRLAALFFGKETEMHAGSYQFHTRENVFSVAKAIMTGNSGLTLVPIRVPEGDTVADIAALFDPATFSDFDQKIFLTKATPFEGYLFPDTYLFLPTATADTVLSAMKVNFFKKVSDNAQSIYASKRPLEDIIVMASLLEKEARSSEVRRTIAGILWKRIELDMPLQVDAVFGYIKGRDTYSPTLDDLLIKSPYNTYLHVGLPQGAIGNPSLNAILAAANPIETKYLYYLSDKNGVMHYGTTFTQHLANKKKYLHQ
ncbi:MAG TPA: endolytic transglycosylase MltG [Candidatus Paceibacterota bacterium]